MQVVEDGDITATKVAQFFLAKKELTPKKLQKLVYYVYAWFIALNNDSPDNISSVLFEEQPQAWVHGPVFPSLFHEYHQYGWHEIPKTKDRIKFANDDVQALLSVIWSKFGDYSADELEAMTHSELPWREARDGTPFIAPSDTPLNLSTIYTYYNGLSQANNNQA